MRSGTIEPQFSVVVLDDSGSMHLQDDGAKTTRIAIGEALNDGPPAPSTETYVRTLEPVPQQPATTTSP